MLLRWRRGYEASATPGASRRRLAVTATRGDAMIERWLRWTVVTGSLVAATGAAAQLNKVDLVKLRTNCGTDVVCTTLNPVTNTQTSCCLTSMTTLNSWLWGQRKPSATKPVLVDVGPGEFGAFDCPAATGGNPANGYVTVRGSGRETTTIRRATFSAGQGAVTLKSCQRMTFQDLTVSGAGVAVSWLGTGSTQWFNVGIEAQSAYGFFAYGWYDEQTTAPTPRPVHYWFSTKVRTTGAVFANAGFLARASEHWFYGGEVEANLSSVASGATITLSAPVWLDGLGDFRAFGSALRSRTDIFCGDVTAVGVQVSGGGHFHMHGGIINATATPDSGSCAQNMNATGLLFQGNDHVHTPGTAFIVRKNANGVARRLQHVGTGTVESPYQWPPSATPPAIESLNGADIFVETDCADAPANVASNCNGGGSETHLMVYSSSCPSKWFDATQGECRP